jgi:hypothetical protein
VVYDHGLKRKGKEERKRKERGNKVLNKANLGMGSILKFWYSAISILASFLEVRHNVMNR